MLFFDSKPCKRPRYQLTRQAISEYEVPPKGSLLKYGLDGARKGEILELKISCKGAMKLVFEVTSGSELAIYYDGNFFFLSKGKVSGDSR